MAILIKYARVFAPKGLGVVDVLMANERILAVGKDLAPNLPDLQTVEAGGMFMTPGFFGQHTHVTGGGGGGGAPPPPPGPRPREAAPPQGGAPAGGSPRRGLPPRGGGRRGPAGAYPRTGAKL